MFGTYRTLSFFGVAIIIVFFVAKPQFDAAQALEASITEYTATFENVSAYNQKLASLIAQRDAISVEDRAKIETLAGAGGINPAQVVYNIEQAVARSGMSLEGIHAYELQRPRTDSRTASQASIQASDFATQDFEVTMSGTYASLKRMLQTIEGSLEPYTVMYVKFANERQASLLSYTVRIRVYALAE